MRSTVSRLAHVRRKLFVAISGALLISGTPIFCYADSLNDSTADSTHVVEGITVTASRAGAHDPVSYSNLSKEVIAHQHTLGDPTLLAASLPGVYTFSDGGGSLGYTYMSIRGFDDHRIATYLNGVPLNDPEDQYSYWVDLPDFLSSVTDIQVQRGVGNAQYGDPAFGGSINVISTLFARPRETRVRFGQGFLYANEHKSGESSLGSVDFSSGLIDHTYAFHGRFSRQKSDGYRENSWAQGSGYFLSIGRLDPNMSTELLVFGGPENLHLSYLGITRDQIASDRRFNPFTYVGETDNFSQPHYHLHHHWDLSDKLSFSNTLYYVRGRGYFEQSFPGVNLIDYGIDSTLTNNNATGDLVRQQSVVKGQLGWTGKLTSTTDAGTTSLVGSLYLFHSDHGGDVVRATDASSALLLPHQYYRWYGKKQVGSLGVEFTRMLSPKLTLSGGLHGRVQHYDFSQEKLGLFPGYEFTTDWFFASPRIGAVWSLVDVSNQKLDMYLSASMASRAPTDAALYDASDPYSVPSLSVKNQTISGTDTTKTFGDPLFDAERVTAIELGLRGKSKALSGSMDIYYMNFSKEIIPYGGINASTGQLATANAAGSTRVGFELEGKWEATHQLSLTTALSWQSYRVNDFIDTLDVYDPAGNYLRSDQYRFQHCNGLAFPDYLVNLRGEYRTRSFESALRLQGGGKQYMELGNIDSLTIKPFATVGFDIGYTTKPIRGIGSLRALVSIDNLFNRKFERSGYGWNYLTAADVNAPATLTGGAEYYVAAERTIFLLVELRFE